ncbi:MAG: helicase C-terminal domain-containing protein [Puniceicoccaceae bacterium]
MKINYDSRSLEISVRDLAALASGTPSPVGPRLRRRAEIGSIWHRHIQQEPSELSENEVGIFGPLSFGQWTFNLRGRIDQILKKQPDCIRIREIKTITASDPELLVRPDLLRSSYPSAFLQTGIYRLLLSRAHHLGVDSITAEVLFIDLVSGKKLSCEHLANDLQQTAFDLHSVADFLEARQEANRTLRQFAPTRPWRPQQADALQAFYHAPSPSQAFLFQAPTGFGKTAVFVHWALDLLRQQAVERVVFITAKRTGREQIKAELSGLFGEQASRTIALEMRSREEHRPECRFLGCRAQSCDPQAPNPRPRALFETLASPASSSPAHQHPSPPDQLSPCPYQTNRGLLPFFYVWIADLNYVFADSSNHVFLESFGYQPSRTLLVIDEAHLLPERVAAAWSVGLTASDCRQLSDALAFHAASPGLSRQLDEISEHLDRLPPAADLPLTEVYWIEDSLQNFIDEYLQSHLSHPLEEHSAEILSRLFIVRDRLTDEETPALRHLPSRGTLRIECTDPSTLIQKTLDSYHLVCLASATLQPYQIFTRSIGLAPEVITIIDPPPIWSTNQLDLAIDCRVDTRSQRRDQHLATTALTAIRFATSPGLGPLVVFCPSFAYLELLAVYLEGIEPSLRLRLSNRQNGDDLAATLHHLSGVDLLLLVLGSRLSESIDHLGGNADRVMVISPGIPEVSAVRARARRDLDLTGEDGFQQQFLLPGMKKIIQAVGRLVRAPDHRARVLLHCRRFADPAYQATFPDWWPQPTVLRSDAAAGSWIDTPFARLGDPQSFEESPNR